MPPAFVFIHGDTFNETSLASLRAIQHLIISSSSSKLALLEKKSLYHVYALPHGLPSPASLLSVH